MELEFNRNMALLENNFLVKRIKVKSQCRILSNKQKLFNTKTELENNHFTGNSLLKYVGPIAHIILVSIELLERSSYKWERIRSDLR
jgi:hypothetical protein